MNETDLSRENRRVMCADGQGPIGTGCGERDDCGIRYFTHQRVGEYIQGGCSSTLMARDYKSASDLAVEQTSKPQRKYIVRRLTPLEATRLQGMPDNWFDGVDGSDSAKYKALGNGLALPCAYDVINRIARYMEWENTNDNLPCNNPEESQEIP